MMDVVPHRMLWTLDRNQILVLAFSTGHGQPIEARGPLVLVTLDEVPPEYKVFCDIVDAVTDDTHGHIMPGHAAVVGFAQLVGLPVIDGLEIHDAVVVEVLTGEHFVLHPRWMGVGQRMLAIIPSAETQVKAADEGHLVVDDDEFLMMGPVEGHVASILKDIVVGVTHDGDVTMARASLGAEGVEGVFGVGAVAAEGLSDLLVDDDIDLDASLCPPLQDLIEPPFLVVVGWSTKEQLRTQPPVFDVDGLFCFLQRDGDGVEVVLAIDVPLDLVPISFRSEGTKAMALCDTGPLLVGESLVLFIMAMVGVDDVAKLADLVLQVDCADLCVVEVCSCCEEIKESARVPHPIVMRGLGRLGGGEVTLK